MAEPEAPEETPKLKELPSLPEDALIILPVRDLVLFPRVVLPISIGRQRSIMAAQYAVREQRQIGVLTQRDPEMADPAPVDLYRIGTVANIVRFVTTPDGTHNIVCQGEERFHVTEFLSGWPFFVARVLRIPDAETRTPEIEARFLHLQRQAIEALELLPQAPKEMISTIQGVTSPGTLADLAVAYMDIPTAEKQEILETVNLAVRMEKVSKLLAHRIEVLRLSQEIGRQTKAALDQRQRRCCCASKWPPFGASSARPRTPRLRRWPSSSRP